MNPDEQYMLRAIELARMGAGQTAPNPLVGAVIVHADKIIGEGYHQKYGEAHAEVNAVNSVTNKQILSESTIYVTLEPCAHFGKTPPCADLLIRHRFKKVVVGSRDPFEAVDGKGIQKLLDAGINVETGVLEKDCLELNKRFFTFHTKKRPFIILKWAQTADGLIDIERSDNTPGINWITGPGTQVFVHQMRAGEAAILTGWRTIANDDPELTVRAVKGKDPLRVVIDRNGKIPENAKILTDGKPTVVFNATRQAKVNETSWIIPADFSPQAIARELYQLSIISVIVEGGADTLKRFIAAGLWDEAVVITGKTTFGKGLAAPLLTAGKTGEFSIDGDTVTTYRNL